MSAWSASVQNQQLTAMPLDNTWPIDDEVEVLVRGTFLAFRARNALEERPKRSQSLGNLPRARSVGAVNPNAEDCESGFHSDSTETPTCEPSTRKPTTPSSHSSESAYEIETPQLATTSDEETAKDAKSDSQCTASPAPAQPGKVYKPTGTQRRRARRNNEAAIEQASGAASRPAATSAAGFPKTCHAVCDLHGSLMTAEDACACKDVCRMVDAMHQFGKLCEAAPGEASHLVHEAKFLDLVEHLKQFAGQIKNSRYVARCIWGIAKIGFGSPGVGTILSNLVQTVMQIVPSFTHQELSSSLWGLARLADAHGTCREPAEAMSWYIVEESCSRLSSFTPQCLVNSLYAVAKLGLWGDVPMQFAQRCIEEMCHERNITQFSTQGLANAIWAAARLDAPGKAGELCSAAAREVIRRPQQLQEFQPMELSMTMWAMAKIISKQQTSKGRRGWSHCRQSSRGQNKVACQHVLAFMLASAAEGERRMSQHSPQGLSNIAFALTTLQLHEQPEAKDFLLAAAKSAMQNMQGFGQQAVANLCSALAKLQDEGSKATVELFMERAAWQAHLHDFKWQDLAEMITAMSRNRGTQSSPALRTFAARLAQHTATAQPRQVGKQALLNIGLAVTRMGVAVETVWPLAESVNKLFTDSHSHHAALNAIDHRQWVEIKTYCRYDCDGTSYGYSGASTCTNAGWQGQVYAGAHETQVPMGSMARRTNSKFWATI